MADQPLDDVVGTWEVCSPESIPRFSAVEYFFGRDLHQALHVPMGLIESDWGGTPAQSWTSRQALEADPALKFILDDWDRTLANYPAAKEAYDKRLEAWTKTAEQAKVGRQDARRRVPARPPDRDIRIRPRVCTTR